MRNEETWTWTPSVGHTSYESGVKPPSLARHSQSLFRLPVVLVWRLPQPSSGDLRHFGIGSLDNSDVSASSLSFSSWFFLQPCCCSVLEGRSWCSLGVSISTSRRLQVKVYQISWVPPDDNQISWVLPDNNHCCFITSSIQHIPRIQDFN